MKIAVAGDKGGIDKTLIFSNLPVVTSMSAKVAFYGLDVEEPDVDVSFNNEYETIQSINKMISGTNKSGYNHCGIYSQISEYYVLNDLKDNAMVFPELVHDSNASLGLCPVNAIEEGKQETCEMKYSKIGRAREHFVVYTETEESMFGDNYIKVEAAQRSGTSDAQMMIDNEIQALATEHVGPKVGSVLKSTKIKIFMTEGNITLRDVYQKIKGGTWEKQYFREANVIN